MSVDTFLFGFLLFRLHVRLHFEDDNSSVVSMVW